MSELVFMMGQYEARIPTDRQYAPNHMWAVRAGRSHRFGFTAYAERMLRDVYFLEWYVDPGTQLKVRQAIGEIESKKAESQLFAPADGLLRLINDALMYDPSGINKDTYDEGWLFEMELTTTDLLQPEAYVEHLASVWELTQRTIKGDSCKLI